MTIDERRAAEDELQRIGREAGTHLRKILEAKRQAKLPLLTPKDRH